MCSKNCIKDIKGALHFFDRLKADLWCGGAVSALLLISMVTNDGPAPVSDINICTTNMKK